MLKAKVKYIGRRAHGNNCRYAEIITPVENTGIVSGMLHDSGYNYSVLYEDYETVFMVNVYNMADYKVFMSAWKKAKKGIGE